MKNNAHHLEEAKKNDVREPSPASSAPRSDDNQNFFFEILKFALIAALIVVPIRVFLIQPFIVNGASMEPSFETGEYLIVDQITYAFGVPERGDVVIFRYPRDPSKFFIKRVIGLPGETVRIQGENIIIENKHHPSGFLLEEPYLDASKRKATTLTTKLENDEYFVLGDNRKESSDSRVWGPLPDELIVGRALLRLFPPTKDFVLPGSSTLERETL